ncbi:MAG: ABC transporter substrate-binding protein [Desulfobacterales bacterium]|nr:ABC transporter substrate-binding protein [Desulfobacterales bacterium]
MIRRIFLCCFAFLLVSFPAIAPAETQSVETILKGKLDFIFFTLKRDDVDLAKKKHLITQEVSPIFDFPLMGKLTLGKKNWSTLTKPQKNLFIKTFTDVMKRSYSDKLSLYTDEKIEIHPAKSPKPNKAIIPTELISKENRYAMEYKFYRSKKGWKIYDIELQGVSLVATYRTQFNQVISEGGFDLLITKLGDIKV